MTHAAATASAPVLTHLLASVLGHDSDRGETIAHALVGEPIWTGPADAIQLLGVDRDRREARDLARSDLGSGCGSGRGLPSHRRRAVMLEVRAAGGSQRVVQRKLTAVAGGAFADTIKLDRGRCWVVARTEADASNVPGESPAVATVI